MCDVCVAINLINGQVIQIIPARNGSCYGIKGTSVNGPEHGPCSYFLKKNGKWSAKIKTTGNEDLATIVAKAGFDISPEVRKKHHDDFIEQQFKLHTGN